MPPAFEEYRSKYERYESEVSDVNRKIRFVSNLRLSIFIMACIGAVVLFRTHEFYWMSTVIIAAIVAFIAAVMRHNDLYKKKSVCEKLLLINKKGMVRLDGKWGEFTDCGEEFIDHNHPYTWDLDIFGKNSVFQMLCACHTHAGRKYLAEALSKQEKEHVQIRNKQEAVRELSSMLSWRQSFELHGMSEATANNPDKFLLWCEDGVVTFKFEIVKRIFRTLPFVSLIIGFTGLVLTHTFVFFAIMYCIHLLIFTVNYFKMLGIIGQYEKNGSLLLDFSKLVGTIEKEHFSSVYLQKLKKEIENGQGGQDASSVLRALSKVLCATEIRYNPVGHFIANAVWLWDIQCVLKADRIKQAHGRHFRSWINTIGNFEMLSSLSILSFENPDFTFPEIDDKSISLMAKDAGHPLLHKKTRVVNDIEIRNAGEVAIITGSNMSGKSTFLRSIGLNAVLGYAGCAVCASFMRLPVVNIYTSMRIYDDLSSRVSTFYAELLRIRMMVDAVRRGEPVLFLLDELFRGTNSEDRHDGAVAVLRNLSVDKSLGLISTHDLDLCKLSSDEPDRYVNYHFEEHYENNNIAFDYRLRSGMSTTRNAMFLIKMIGIDK